MSETSSPVPVGESDDSLKIHPAKPSLYAIFGWVLGSFSVLNLIDEASPIRLMGKMHQLMEAYLLLMHRIFEFLFGWIHVSWMQISEIESHLLVLTWVQAAAFTRFHIRSWNSLGRFFEDGKVPFTWFGFLVPVFFVFLFGILPALFALCLPGHVGVAVTAACFVVISWSFFFNPKKYQRRGFITELGAIGILVLIMVVLNYTLFRTPA